MFVINKNEIVEISIDFKNILLFHRNNVIIKKRGMSHKFSNFLKIDGDLYDMTFSNDKILVYEKRDNNEN